MATETDPTLPPDALVDRLLELHAEWRRADRAGDAKAREAALAEIAALQRECDRNGWVRPG